NSQYASYIKEFFKTKTKEKLSKPSLESLAIIAYKQPVTRADIELVRGVNSDGVVNHLLEKELIKIVGRKEVAGRPYLYGTTRLFLEYFGLKSLDDLPKLEEFPVLAEKVNNEYVTVDEDKDNEKDAPVIQQDDPIDSKTDEDGIIENGVSLSEADGADEKGTLENEQESQEDAQPVGMTQEIDAHKQS
ncbi:MAG: SMC-Scp complex subunit ScpB, partial [Candidatus Omnitrophica bacterium]|nr:SMC-Scp complex subunit ScpB [Candidatus Omnitrophota bacterium]